MEDVIFLSVMLLAIVFSLVIIIKIVNELHDSGKFDMNTEAADAMDELNTDLLGKFDFIILAVFIGSFLSICAAAIFLRTSPIFWIFGFLITLIGTIISAVISNVFHRVQDATQLTSAIAQVPLGVWVLNYMPYIYVIFSFAVMTILYGVSSSRTEEYR